MAAFKNILELRTESGQSVSIDLRNALILTAAPTTSTAARAGMQAYVVSGGTITAEYVCTAVSGSMYTWVKREISGSGGGSAEVTAESIKNALGYTPADDEDVTKLSEAIADLQGESIPDYWYGAFTDSAGKTYTEYLLQKLARIKELHQQHGKDCFSFVLMTDIHYAQNLGKRSPLIAAKIMDETEIKYAICAGDVQNRECMSTKEEVLAENVLIEKMFEPLKNRVLFEQGNHDGSYSVVNGVAYAKNLTPQEMHEFLFRKVGMVGDVHFDDTGTAYYIDDVSNNVRYIGLNTQCNEYVPQKDNPDKYPNMTHFRFTQPQFDFLTKEALVTGLTAKSKVIVFGHCPLWQEIGDADVMISVLNAYKDKGKVENAVYEGTAEGGNIPTYKNFLDESGDGFLWGYYSDGNETPFDPNVSIRKSGFFSNYIPITTSKTNPDLLRVLDKNKKLLMVKVYDKDKNPITSLPNWIVVSTTSDFVYDENGVVTWKAAYVDDYVATAVVNSLAYVRLYFRDESDMDLNDFAVTVNEEITYTEGESGSGYDYVKVNADFTEAKGELIGYFAGHNHYDISTVNKGFLINATRSDSPWENGPDSAELRAERVKDTITEQSFSVFTVTPGKVYETKIGAGADRVIEYTESVPEKVNQQ